MYKHTMTDTGSTVDHVDNIDRGLLDVRSAPVFLCYLMLMVLL